MNVWYIETMMNNEIVNEEFVVTFTIKTKDEVTTDQFLSTIGSLLRTSFEDYGEVVDFDVE